MNAVASRVDFERNGFCGPIALFTADECGLIAEYLRRDDHPAPAEWDKGRAVNERFLYDLATRSAILEPVSEILGENVVLWGVSSVVRAAGEVHPWHSDIESCAPEGGFVSVWIGVENTSRDSSLQIIRGSHQLGRSVQEARGAADIPREAATPETLLEIARKHDPEAEVVAFVMTDGEAVFFDGRLWHGTDNRSAEERVGLIVQFAAADRPVRIPDWSVLDWPFRLRADPKPPVVVVRGTDHDGPNRTVPPPAPSTPRTLIESVVHSFDLPIDDLEPTEPWRPFPAFRGATRTCTDMSCHASVLAAGHAAHPPHAHVEEELLVVLHGEAEVIVPSRLDDPDPRTERLLPGELVYYPAWQQHTIRNESSEPVAYVMLKWNAQPAGIASRLETQVIRTDELSPPGDTDPFRTRLLFEGPTDHLGKLHAHLASLEPGAGYDPHRDAHDVAIVTLEGEIEAAGQAVEPWSVVYFGAGELHGMRNTGNRSARYLVFEFHAPGTRLVEPSPQTRVEPALVRGCKRLARPIWRRIAPIVRRAR